MIETKTNRRLENMNYIYREYIYIKYSINFVPIATLLQLEHANKYCTSIIIVIKIFLLKYFIIYIRMKYLNLMNISIQNVAKIIDLLIY